MSAQKKQGSKPRMTSSSRPKRVTKAALAKKKQIQRRRTIIWGVVGLAVVMGGVILAATVSAASAPGPSAVTSQTPLAQHEEVQPDALVESLPAHAVNWPDEATPVGAQLAYIRAHWNNPNTAEYGYLDEVDCVDFASQSLIVRGWEMDDTWWAEGTGDDFDFSYEWVHSTYFSDYLAASGRATEIAWADRAQVKQGDIAIFDWDNSGDRDHVGIVTAVQTDADGVRIYYAGHTDDTLTRSVDWAITVNHPGAKAYFWSVP